MSGRRHELFGFACAAGVALHSLGCRLGPTKDAARTGAPADPRTGLFELRTLPDRPPISLVARAGDPHGSVALATAHDLGSEASVGVATLLEARLEAEGFPGAESRAHALGFEVFTLVNGPAEAARFVQVAAGALRTPLSQREPGLATVRTKLNALRGLSLIHI